MAKNKRKSKSSNQRSKQQPSRGPRRNWRRLIERSLFAIGVMAMAGIAMAAYHNNKQLEYDLSVIGNGTATVVQVHDPDCQLCRRLKNNLDSVKGDFKSDIQFKTAMITQDQGRRFAQSHNVPHVTLVLFNKGGQRVNSLQGVTPADNIREALDALVKPR